MNIHFAQLDCFNPKQLHLVAFSPSLLRGQPIFSQLFAKKSCTEQNQPPNGKGENATVAPIPARTGSDLLPENPPYQDSGKNVLQ